MCLNTYVACQLVQHALWIDTLNLRLSHLASFGIHYIFQVLWPLNTRRNIIVLSIICYGSNNSEEIPIMLYEATISY